MINPKYKGVVLPEDYVMFYYDVDKDEATSMILSNIEWGKDVIRAYLLTTIILDKYKKFVEEY
jgi:hypothetical protein